MSAVRLVIGTSITAAALVMVGTTPASAFHHVVLPADDCGQSAYAGGANPTARDALREHNTAQDLPLPPAGTPAVDSLPDPCAAG
ncbi:MAG TPA: hypothetical protein VFR87_09470 [Nocardioidaceae bacterium]|nr:hypothetical protein [Nocardioidaceae bacterium]